MFSRQMASRNQSECSCSFNVVPPCQHLDCAEAFVLATFRHLRRAKGVNAKMCGKFELNSEADVAEFIAMTRGMLQITYSQDKKVKYLSVRTHVDDNNRVVFMIAGSEAAKQFWNTLCGDSDDENPTE